MRAVLDALERGVVFLGSVAMACLAIEVAGLVALRYLFGISPFWSEEVIRICLLVAVFLGAAVSVRGRRHIRVEFLTELLPARVREAWYLLLDVFALVIFGVLVWTGIEAVGFNDSQRTVALQMPLSWIMWLVPAAFALAIVFLVEEIARGKQRTK
ncbi:MAG: TRAP transporter small permease [Alphaproteobacteria bacterium]